MSASSRYSRLVLRLYRWIWLGRVDSDTPSIPPRAIVFAAHYNGAVDGMAYGSQIPPARGVVSVQWHQHLIGRLMFPGISVQRAKDADKGGANNIAAFREMIDCLAEDDRLLFFPEGTSRLGTARLPIGRGTLLLLRRARSLNPPPQVFFCAAHYHDPTRWRSDVSLGWVGPVPMPAPASDEAWVTANLLEAQTRAYARPAPRRLGLAWLAGTCALPYLPVWALVSGLAHRTADDDNVIGLWKFLFGVPATALSLLLYTVLAIVLGVPVWLPAASLLMGWLLWNR